MLPFSSKRLRISLASRRPRHLWWLFRLYFQVSRQKRGTVDDYNNNLSLVCWIAWWGGFTSIRRTQKERRFSTCRHRSFGRISCPTDLAPRESTELHHGRTILVIGYNRRLFWIFLDLLYLVLTYRSWTSICADSFPASSSSAIHQSASQRTMSCVLDLAWSFFREAGWTIWFYLEGIGWHCRTWGL